MRNSSTPSPEAWAFTISTSQAYGTTARVTKMSEFSRTQIIHISIISDKAFRGITHCSTPKAYYWFNIVQIILDELLSGATIALPSELTEILNILRLCSHLMFAFFLAGTVLAFVLVFLSPIAIFSRWWSLPMAFISAITFILIFAASTIASVISFVFKYAATAQSSLNIDASVGMKMFVFMWIATGFALVGFILHAGMGCCCTSRRDLKKGKKPMRHSSLHRAMSQRSQVSQASHAKSVSMVAGGQGRSRSNTAFSYEQPTGGRSRSGTLLSTNDVAAETSEGGVSRSGSQHGSSGSVSRSGTLRDNSGSVSRSGTMKSDINRSNTVKSNLAQTGRSRSGTMRSIRFDDEKPPSYESDTTAVNGLDGSREGVSTSRQRHSALKEEE